jgi:hypothetical protein
MQDFSSREALHFGNGYDKNRLFEGGEVVAFFSSP